MLGLFDVMEAKTDTKVSVQIYSALTRFDLQTNVEVCIIDKPIHGQSGLSWCLPLSLASIIVVTKVLHRLLLTYYYCTLCAYLDS